LSNIREAPSNIKIAGRNVCASIFLAIADKDLFCCGAWVQIWLILAVRTAPPPRLLSALRLGSDSIAFFPHRRFIAPFFGVGALYAAGTYSSCWTWVPTVYGWQQVWACDSGYGYGYGYDY
jgi:hypothetical protein